MIIFFDVGDVADFVVTPFCYTLLLYLCERMPVSEEKK